MKQVAMAVMVLGLAVFHTGKADASIYSDSVNLLVDLGVTDQATVKHNVGVYESILTSIESTIKNKSIPLQRKQLMVMYKIVDLSTRFESQLNALGELGAMVVRTISPEIDSAIQKAKAATRISDYKTVLNMSAEIRNELNHI